MIQNCLHLLILKEQRPKVELQHSTNQWCNVTTHSVNQGQTSELTGFAPLQPKRSRQCSGITSQLTSDSLTEFTLLLSFKLLSLSQSMKPGTYSPSLYCHCKLSENYCISLTFGLFVDTQSNFAITGEGSLICCSLSPLKGALYLSEPRV